MKRVISFLAIIMVLTACQPATSTAVPTTTIEVLPSATLTSTPEPTATATQTATVTPAVNFVNNTTPESFRDNPLGTFDFTNPESVAKYNQVMKDYYDWASKLAQNTQFGPDVQPVVLREHIALAFGGKILYPDNLDAVKAIDYKEFFEIDPVSGIAYPARVYTFSLHTADGNLPIIATRSYYEPANPSNQGVSVDKINQYMDEYGTPDFKEWNEVLPIMAADIYPGDQEADPAAAQALKNYPDLASRIDKAATTDTQVGDPKELSSPGLTFLTFEAKNNPNATFW
jgi:hypothetical protein